MNRPFNNVSFLPQRCAASLISRSVPCGGPQPTPPLSAPLPCGVPAMVSWSGPVSLRKGLAGGLDGTAPPAVSSIPIHLTSSVEDTL